MGRTPPKIIKEVIFTPTNADVVEIYNEGTFTTVETGLTGNAKFAGTGAVVGSKVVFTPFSADVVGIYDVTERTFTTVDTGLTGVKFIGSGAVVGSKVVFTPYNADVVGIYDVNTGTFTTVETTGLTGIQKFADTGTIIEKVL